MNKGAKVQIEIGNKTLTLSQIQDYNPRVYSFRDQFGNGFATGRTANGGMKIFATSFIKQGRRWQYREYKTISDRVFQDSDFQGAA